MDPANGGKRPDTFVFVLRPGSTLGAKHVTATEQGSNNKLCRAMWLLDLDQTAWNKVAKSD
jgi:hypothetical protein